MTNIDELFKSHSAYRPRTSTSLDLVELNNTLVEQGFIELDVYISTKKDENPNGMHYSKARELLLNGDLSDLPEDRQAYTENFRQCFYTISVDSKGLRKMIVLVPQLEREFINNGFVLKPMTDPLRQSSTSSSDNQDLEEPETE